MASKDTFQVGQVVKASNGLEYRVVSKGGRAPWAKRYCAWNVKSMATQQPDQFATNEIKAMK
jgi:hypothetical protein